MSAVDDALHGFAALCFDEDDFQDPEASDDDALAAEDVLRASEEEARVGAGARVDAHASAHAFARPEEVRSPAIFRASHRCPASWLRC